MKQMFNQKCHLFGSLESKFFLEIKKGSVSLQKYFAFHNLILFWSKPYAVKLIIVKSLKRRPWNFEKREVLITQN